MTPVSNTPITIAQNETFAGTSVSEGVSISNWTQGADWTLFVTISGCFAGPALVSIEDSADEWDTDIQVVATINVTGPINAGTYVGQSWRARELPSFRVGQLNAEARVSVTAGSSASVTLSIAEIK